MVSSAPARPSRVTPPAGCSGTRSDIEGELRAQPYWALIPDGDYLAVGTGFYWDRASRTYGERIYVYFRIFEGQHAGTELRMFLRPSRHPTSNFYRAWSIANDSPPRSRKTRMSARIFLGKLFKVKTATVRPRHQLTGPDGKRRPGPFLPEYMAYSKVVCLLSLEVTNQPIGDFSAHTPVSETPPKSDGASPFIVTENPRKSFPESAIAEGEVGRRELGVGNRGPGTDSSGWGERSTNAPQPASGGGNAAAGLTPLDPGKHEEAAPHSHAPHCGREHLERAIFRTKLFQAHDAMSPKFGLERCIEKLVYEAVHDLCMDRARELEGISEESLVEKALARLKGALQQFQAIRDWEKRRNQIVACVVNAVVDAALAAHAGRTTAHLEVRAET